MKINNKHYRTVWMEDGVVKLINQPSMREVIQQVIEAETEARQILESAQAEAEALLDDARARAHDVLDRARRETLSEGEQLVATSRAEAEQEKHAYLQKADAAIREQVVLKEDAR